MSEAFDQLSRNTLIPHRPNFIPLAGSDYDFEGALSSFVLGGLATQFSECAIRCHEAREHWRHQFSRIIYRMSAIPR
jgi:hypothetical protein